MFAWFAEPPLAGAPGCAFTRLQCDYDSVSATAAEIPFFRRMIRQTFAPALSTHVSPVRRAANTMVPSMYMAAPQFPPTMSLPRPVVFPPHSLSSMSTPQSPVTLSSHGELVESLNSMAIATQPDGGNVKSAEKRDSVQRSESVSSPGVIGQGSSIDQRLA